MSWFKLNVNDSLNSLKGQITNVSNVVHDVFTEGILDDANANVTENADDADDGSPRSVATADDVSDVEMMEAANRKIEELSSLCTVQDSEINTLRRQIADLLNADNSPIASGSGGNANKTIAAGTTNPPNSAAKKDASKALEDSWFWDSEKSPSSASSKDNEHSSTHNLTSVSLLDDDKHEATGIVEKLRRTIDEKNDEIKRLNVDAVEHHESIERLRNENNEINLQIEQLDQQHSDAVERVLTVKNELQIKCQQLENDLAAMRVDHIVVRTQLEELTQQQADLLRSNEELIAKYDQVEASYVKALQDNANITDEKDLIRAELERRMIEISELTLALEEKEREAIEKFEIVEMEKDRMLASASNDNESTADEHQRMILSTDDGKDRCDSSASMVSVEEQLMQLRTESDALVEELKIAREATSKAEDLKISYEALNAEKAALETELTEMKEAYKTLKVEASDLENRLLQENMMFQKQVIDLQSELDSRKNDANSSNTHDSITLNELRSILSQQMNYTSAAATNISIKQFVKDFIRSIKATYQKLQEIEVNRDDLMKQFESVSGEKAVLQQENERLKLELAHFETEVAELMKNNEILLVELENVKAGKLEPISEHNEDSIVDLEKQLEDVSTLNQSLEDEYKNLRLKMDEKEEEKYELIEKLEAVELQYADQADKIDELKQQLKELETEKSIILFELNEYKTDNVKDSDENKARVSQQEMELIDLRQRLDELVAQNAQLNKYLQLQENEMQCKLQDLEQAHEKISKFEDLQSKCSCNDRPPIDADTIANQQEVLQGLKSTLDVKLNEISILEEKLRDRDDLCQSQEAKIADLESTISRLEIAAADQTSSEVVAQLNDKITVLNREKQELIAAVQQKHNENVDYHNQIQQLNQMLNREMSNLSAMQQQYQQQQNVPCQKCNESSEQLKLAMAEALKLNDQITFLREKSDILMGNLMTEQNNQKILSQEKIDLLEEKQTLSKELTRLREHLIEMENGHTAEMVELQNAIDQTKQQMASMQEEAKKSSTAYTSASIRANQHTETLQAQYAVLQQQRDEVAKKLSAAEDREQKNQAALINLQCALEQFQKDKDRDVETMTQRIRKELNDEKAHTGKLLQDIEYLQQQLAECQDGLLAAARISDELELSESTNVALKDELSKCQAKLIELEQRLHDTESNQSDRVDKNLLKNLLIGYIVAPNHDKAQILKLLSSVLDFNQTESDKVGLNKGHGGWLNTILQGGANSQNANYNKEGLAQAFVKFLEQETQPRNDSSNTPTLLNIIHTNLPATSANPISAATSPNANSQTSIDESNQQHPMQSILSGDSTAASTLPTFATTRNSSSILKDILSDS